MAEVNNASIMECINRKYNLPARSNKVIQPRYLSFTILDF
ncbi:hypothetical protein FDUTEX481_09931 [Tolypothrix sp. PCC 7601]|nr:hypothetical protein FDUTEX481_09931 [Tolypothrix sp. PCC 7601]